MILSILIPTVPNREARFNRLWAELRDQKHRLETVHPTLPKVEILHDNSPRYVDGGLTVGKKREALVQRAEGKYVCFVDDDDWVSPNYLETLVRACMEGRHVVTFNALFKCDGYWALVDMDLNHENEQATPERIVKRGVWHICPILTEIAQAVGFPDINNAEDSAWLSKLNITNQYKVNHILYQYNHSASVSEVDRI